MSPAILYVSFDGILQPLAFSQVARIVAGLGRRGKNYHLLSVERPQDLLDNVPVERVRVFLARSNVRWTPLSARLGGSAARSGAALARVVAAISRLIHSQAIRVIHARGYQSALAASIASRGRVPFIFDARGCWIDERGDWFASPTAYAAGKLVERQLYSKAAAVVTLTQLHANDVVDGAFGHVPASRVFTIPTCADYEEFTVSPARPRRPASSKVVTIPQQSRLRDKCVLAIVGALNSSYFLDATMRLLYYACATSEDAHVLVVTRQEEAYASALTAAGIAPHRFTITSADHMAMPEWVAWMDWAPLFSPDVIAQRGKMPTKLAEFFAAGVRPIAFGCNSEVLSWVDRAGSGLVLPDLRDDTLRKAASDIQRPRPPEELLAARRISEEHFSLTAGIDRYVRLLDPFLTE